MTRLKYTSGFEKRDTESEASGLGNKLDVGEEARRARHHCWRSTLWAWVGRYHFLSERGLSELLRRAGRTFLLDMVVPCRCWWAGG